LCGAFLGKERFDRLIRGQLVSVGHLVGYIRAIGSDFASGDGGSGNAPAGMHV
jgi:hypothetical protein